MSEELDKILTESTGILLAVDELRKQIPRIEKIKTEIQNKKDEIKKEISDFYSQEQDDKENLKQYINKSAEKLDNYVKDKLQIFKQSTDKINELLKIVDEKLEETVKIQDSIKKINAETENKNKEVLNTKPDFINSIIDLTADYATPHSISYLFEKYKNTDTPVIVRKIESTPSSPSVWSDNYCFYVTDIKNGNVQGNYYSYGKITDTDKNNPNQKYTLFVLYSNHDEIKKIVQTKK